MTTSPHATTVPDAAHAGSLAIVVNTASGGWRDDYKRTLEQNLTHEQRRGLAFAPGPRLPAAIDRAIAAAPDRLIIAGGDGTLRTAAARAIQAGIPLGLIPLGTMNLLARDLNIPLDFEPALHNALSAPLRQIDAAEVNGQLFLHSSLVGVVPMLAHHRESWRARHTLRTRLARLRRAARAMIGIRPVPLTLELPGHQHISHPSFCLAITNNTLEGAPGAGYTRTALSDARLGIYRATHTGRLGLTRLLVALGAAAWWLDPAFVADAAPSLTVHAPLTHINVSNDGEIDRLTPPLKYRSVHAALRIAAPPDHETIAGP